MSFDSFPCGRTLAWYALQTFDSTGKFVADVLNDADRQHRFSSSVRGQAVDTAAGVLRRRITLDTILQSVLTRPKDKVESDLWTLLQIGIWQLVFSRTPDHAAVDSVVKLTRQVGRSRWSGFVNGVLRNVGRMLTEEFAAEPGADRIPVEPGRYRLLTQPLFDDPAIAESTYFHQAFSMPQRLAQRWHSRLKGRSLWTAGFHNLSVPPISLRVNRLRATVAEVTNAFRELGIAVRPGLSDWSVVLTETTRVTELPGFTEGWWSVQDEAAMQAAELLNPQPGERILDLCAAPGGKTTHLAEISEDRADIIACDVSESRLGRVTESVQRLGLQSVTVSVISSDGSQFPEGSFDAVLVDVPCSNTGVLSRRPEARYRFRETDLPELVALQTRLLMTAFDVVKPGGRIVYSTCSIEPEETTTLLANVAEKVPGLVIEQQHLQMPGDPADGAFVALIQRRA